MHCDWSRRFQQRTGFWGGRNRPGRAFCHDHFVTIYFYRSSSGIVNNSFDLLDNIVLLIWPGLTGRLFKGGGGYINIHPEKFTEEYLVDLFRFFRDFHFISWTYKRGSSSVWMWSHSILTVGTTYCWSRWPCGGRPLGCAHVKLNYLAKVSALIFLGRVAIYSFYTRSLLVIQWVVLGTNSEIFSLLENDNSSE